MAAAGFKWKFRRMGGLNQVVIRGGDDIRRLRDLDPKLWVALSCPAQGLEFDARTLALVDTDKDGRIRIPEIVAAAEWACMRLKDPDLMLRPDAALPLGAIDTSHDVGRRLEAAGKAILAQLGTPDAGRLTQADVEKASRHASEQLFNGDGVLPPREGLDDDVRAFIRDAIAVVGGVADASGVAGLDVGLADAFMLSLRQWRDWRDGMDRAESPLGADTAAGWRLMSELKDKIDDYFLRCELAAYAPAAQDALNLEASPLVDKDGHIATRTLADLPLSKAGPDRPLNLAAGLNPVWREKIERFAVLARPLLVAPEELSRDNWLSLQKALEPFSRAAAGKPAPVRTANAAVAPTASVEDLGEGRIDELLRSGVHERFLALAAKDAQAPSTSADIADAERLVLYALHLHRLLVNFVDFEDFFTPGKKAAFQFGRLYIDGRACELCMPAENVEAHAEVAKDSQLHLLYCACTRRGKPDNGDAGRKMNIVAAVTAGDSSLLGVNRNGVFVDSNGDDWDATVVKTVPNPISVREAIWSPYKRLASLVANQIGKYAGERQAGLMQSAGEKLDAAGAAAAGGTAPKFDMARNVGVLAAVGLALGAIGTAVGSIFSAALGMSWWQVPLALAGLFLVISGPSVVSAWLKLRRRTLGPLLEASSWAINGRVRLKRREAKRLCSLAKLPRNAVRSASRPEA